MKHAPTAQPHIWPGRNIGIRFEKDLTTSIVLSSALCLDCGWVSPWDETTRPTHEAGAQHVCGGR